jgi:hypothetical protein
VQDGYDQYVISSLHSLFNHVSYAMVQMTCKSDDHLRTRQGPLLNFVDVRNGDGETLLLAVIFSD